MLYQITSHVYVDGPNCGSDRRYHETLPYAQAKARLENLRKRNDGRIYRMGSIDGY